MNLALKFNSNWALYDIGRKIKNTLVFDVKKKQLVFFRSIPLNWMFCPNIFRLFRLRHCGIILCRVKHHQWNGLRTELCLNKNTNVIPQVCISCYSTWFAKKYFRRIWEVQLKIFQWVRLFLIKEKEVIFLVTEVKVQSL